MRYTLRLLILTLFLSPTLMLRSQITNQFTCGVTMELTAIGTKLQGRLLAPACTCIPTDVKWYNQSTGELLHTGPVLEYDVQSYGHYIISAGFHAEVPQSSIGCVGTLSQSLLLIAPSCTQPFPAAANIICPDVYTPVCGCDNVTYNNECEAKAAGISKWWAGTCGSTPSPNCGQADFEVVVLSGSPQTGYWVKVVNHSEGNFTHTQLDFGDSCQISQSPQWSSQLHHYSKGGIYQITFTTWNSNQSGCVSSVAKTFATDALSFTEAALPYFLDYVMPGDANKDGMANAYDLLEIGRGYSTSGVPRPDATLEWEPQYAANWPLQLSHGKNYKHIDGNGDGAINEFDTEALELNYQSIQAPWAATPAVGAPVIAARFSQDTIVVDAQNPLQPIDISADIVIGSPAQPVYGLSGVACALRYPDFVGHDPVLLYNPSFLGSPNFVLTLGRDNHNFQQFDMGLARKGGSGASGYGNVAKVNMKGNYIIIIDIIDRQAAKLIPVTLPMEGIRAIDQQGNPMLLSPDPNPDTLWIKVINADEVSDTENAVQATASPVKVSPNPAKNNLTIALDPAKTTWVSVVNILGNTVLEMPCNGRPSLHIDTSEWANGLYTLRARQASGEITEEKIVIAK